MHKVPIEYESPVDNAFLKISSDILPFLQSTNHTPNTITTYSLVTGLLSVYYLYHNKVYYFAVLYLASYFFDCVDGHFARTYKMFSKFGDLYDHISDLLVGGLLLYVVLTKYKRRLTLPIIVIFLLFSYLCLVHTGCRQRGQDHNTKSPESLDMLESLCSDPSDIKLYKYFGSGSYVVFCILLIIYISKH